MRIGIIGSGNMGCAVGVRLSHLGHQVLFGSRNPEPAHLATERAPADAKAVSSDDAARHGDLLIRTIRDPDPAAVLANPSLLAERIVINLNNCDYPTDVQGGAWFPQAIAEQFQAHARRTRVVKALNLIGMESLDTSATRCMRPVPRSSSPATILPRLTTHRFNAYQSCNLRDVGVAYPRPLLDSHSRCSDPAVAMTLIDVTILNVLHDPECTMLMVPPADAWCRQGGNRAPEQGFAAV